MLPDLPMEAWARVASFLPFADRLRAFHALRYARLLPSTGTPPANAFLQFCDEADRAERYVDPPPDEFRVLLLVDMGFHADEVRAALRFARGNIDLAAAHLLSA